MRSDETFIRPIRISYKVSIQHKYKENGKVKTKHFHICNLNHYNMIEWGWFDSVNEKQITSIATALGFEEEIIWDVLTSKLDELYNRIKAEFETTDEYIVYKKHENIIEAYQSAKADFEKQYELKSYDHDYDYCFDVYGNLRSNKELDRVKAEYKARIQYEEESRRSSYQWNNKSSNENYSNSSSLFNSASNYSKNESEMLKGFFRMLARTYHPDSNPDKDTSEEMKLINKLKSQWGV